MNTRPTLTLGAFKKDDKEIILSKVTMDKLAKLAAISTKPTDKKDLVTAQAATQNKVKGDSNNKSSDSSTKIKKIEAQKPNQPKAKKAGFNKENHYAVMKYLQKNYPKCFPDKPPFVPLAIGIHNQLIAIEGFPFSKTKLRQFFANYTRTKNYLASLVVGDDRIGLDGVVTSKVTKEETQNIKQTDNKKSKQITTQKSLEEKTNSANVNTGAA
jgi:hypothetical protein